MACTVKAHPKIFQNGRYAKIKMMPEQKRRLVSIRGSIGSNELGELEPRADDDKHRKAQ